MCPVINAGDGANQHPTQTMLDLYSIYKTQGTLENLNIFMVGDLKYGRTVHSLLQAMSHFNPTFHFISPKELEMPKAYKLFLDELHIPYYEHTELDDVINDADILYMTRVQRERFADPLEYEKVKNVYILKNSMLAGTKDNMRILHPLPRVNEISEDVDDNKKALLFPAGFERGIHSSSNYFQDIRFKMVIKEQRDMAAKKELQVSAVENGTVIDHIPQRNYLT